MSFLNRLASNYSPSLMHSMEMVTSLDVAMVASQNAVLGMENEAEIPAVYRSLSFLTDSVAALPIHEVNDDGIFIKPGDPLLAQPNPGETRHDTMATLMASLIWTGNAYLIPLTRDSQGNVTSIHVANPAEITVGWDRRNLFREYYWRDPDRRLEHGKEIVHIRMNSWPGRAKGVGPITAGRLIANLSQAENEFVYSLWNENATPAVAIEVPDDLGSRETKEFQKEFEEANAAKNRVAVVTAGAKIKALTINPADAEFLLSRQWTVQEWSRLMGVLPFFLGVTSGESMTYSNTESLHRLQLSAHTSPSYLERIENGISLLLPHGRNARFDTSELLRIDQKSRFEANSMAIKAGWMLENEARADEGWEPLSPEDIEQLRSMRRADDPSGESNADA